MNEFQKNLNLGKYLSADDHSTKTKYRGSIFSMGIVRKRWIAWAIRMLYIV
jgi:hypothetical protein